MEPDWNRLFFDAVRLALTVGIIVGAFVLLSKLMGKTPKAALNILLKAFKLEFTSEMGRINFGCAILALLFCLFVPSFTLFGRLVDISAAGSLAQDRTLSYFVLLLLFMLVSMIFVYATSRRSQGQ